MSPSRFFSRSLHVIFALVFAMLACSLPSAGNTGYQQTVEAFLALTDGLEFPAHFRTGDAARTGDEFDVMQYFSVLNHLEMEEGYVLDYVYHQDGMGGFPILYARSASQPRYLTEAEYAAALAATQPESTREQQRLGYLEHIRTDDTPAAFFELAILNMLGSQFYLDWHANYNDAIPICSRAALVDFVMHPELGFDQSLPLPVRLRALLLDPAPRVRLGESEAEVSFLFFTKWGGFYRITYTFVRQFPHHRLDVQEEQLLEYQINVMF